MSVSLLKTDLFVCACVHIYACMCAHQCLQRPEEAVLRYLVWVLGTRVLWKSSEYTN